MYRVSTSLLQFRNVSRKPVATVDRVLEAGETDAHDEEPPVVARLVVEIRSDGSRTIARGAIEDVPSGQKAAIEACGGTPMQLAWALTKSMFKSPSLARKTVRRLLPGGRAKQPEDDA